MLLFAWIIRLGLATPVLQPQLTGEEQYSESFTLSADLSDGSFVLFQTLFFNFGFGDGNAACRILYVPNGGQGLNRKEKYSGSEWSYNATKDRLEVGTCSMQQSTKLEIKGVVDDIDLNIQIRSPLKKVRFPGEKDDAEHIFQSSILLNGADLKGVINGRSIAGKAYMDHNRTNTIIKDVGSLWVRYRGMYGNEPMLFQVYKDTAGTNYAWQWSSTEKAPATVNSAIEMAQVTPEGIHVRLDGIDIQSQRTLYVYNPIQEIGVFGKIAENLVGNPSTITYDAKATKNDEIVSEGILEVTFFE